MRAPDTNAAQQRAALVLFEAALEQTLAQRDAWLVDACAGDVALLAQVRALLAVDSAHDGFSAELDAEFDDEFGHAPGLGDATRGAVTTSGPHRWLPVRPPGQIGPYALDELIGSGGMGAVYSARRNDGLFDQTVAIKFVRPLRGRGSVQALVDAERRLLARMQHPGIAHILDGGTTDNGLHYLVMEFVQGVALDDHARDEGLDARGRVALLVPVCSAVAHAHQHLVLHCDIKPANILVTPDGRPKLIDFGVARLQDVLDAALPQGFTRAYSSPQRLAGEPPAVTDDVYSLGMVLVELLTGDVADPQTLAFAAPLDAELGAIARRALAPERAQRYASVDAFAEDLRRWLAHQPVVAMGAHWRYRARKLLQRHPWRVAAVSLSLAGLVTALAVIATLYGRAESARRDAETRFDQVRSLANYLLFDLDDRLESTPGTTQARRELVGRSQAYLDALGATAGNSPELQREVAVGLARLAEVQGVPGKPHVGEVAAARANLERAERLLDGLVQQRPAEWTWQRDLGRVRYLLALFLGARDNDPARQLATARQAEQHLRRALDGALASNATPKLRADIEVLLTSARLTQADAHKALNDHAAAAALQRQEEERLLALPEPVRAAMEFEYQSGRPAMLLGDSLYYLEQRTEALAAYRRATARFREGLMRAPLNRRLLEGTVIGHWNLSGTLDELGERALALEEIERAIPIVEQIVALDPGNVEGLRYRSMVNGQRAIVLANLGRLDEAIRLTEADLALKESRALADAENAERWRDAAVPLRNLATFYRDHKDEAGQCRVLRRGIAAWERIDQRWGLSELDRRNELEVMRAAMNQRCR